MAIMDAISRPFGGEHTLASVAIVLHKTQKVGSDDDDSDECSDE